VVKIVSVLIPGISPQTCRALGGSQDQKLLVTRELLGQIGGSFGAISLILFCRIKIQVLT